MMPVHEKLKAPPLVEVLCGVYFDSIESLDPMWVGTYWERRKADYPKRQIQPAIIDSPTVNFPLLSVQPLRSWLISANDVFLLQIQSDRFYLNWRANGEQYPEFHDHDGKRGLLSRMLEEYNTFAKYCIESLGTTPNISGIELSKVNHLLQGKHWADLSGLADLLPWLKPYVTYATSPEAEVSVKFLEPRGNSSLQLQLVSGKDVKASRRVVKFETKLTRREKTEESKLRDLFSDSNLEANNVFGHLIPSKERSERFK